MSELLISLDLRGLVSGRSPANTALRAPDKMAAEKWSEFVSVR